MGNHFLYIIYGKRMASPVHLVANGATVANVAIVASILYVKKAWRNNGG